MISFPALIFSIQTVSFELPETSLVMSVVVTVMVIVQALVSDA